MQRDIFESQMVKKITFVAKWSKQGDEKRILIVPRESHADIEKMKNPLKVTVEEIVEKSRIEWN